MNVSLKLSFSEDRAMSGTAEPTQMRLPSTAEASIHHRLALLTVVTMSLKLSEPTTMKTAMNATAIVKIVRGLGVAHEGGAQLAQQVGTAQALIDRRGKNGLLDDGGARDEGLLAHAASTGLECALRSHGQCREHQHLRDVDGLV